MEIIRTPRIMQETSRRLLTQGRTIGFVPTMGALHDGHLYLVKRARSENDIVVASIFVNPAQFGPNEDFVKYPRDFDSDMTKLETAGVDVLFYPEVSAVYPAGFSTYIEVRGLSEKLCGVVRPGHFMGVATVVCKFFQMVLPTRAYFGQKDFQQSRVIEQMVRDLNMSVDCLRCSTIRESDGVAMSSRNRYLAPAEREAARVIYRTLQAAARSVEGGMDVQSVKAQIMNMLSAEPLITDVQYAGIYDPETLDERVAAGRSNLLAAAVKIGSTRLIDNLVLEL
jgi:pantoate--beta-alanine ligase